MAVSPKTTSIILSVLVAAGLVGAAFYFSGSPVRVADAGSTEELLRAYAEKDTDGDLLPDWQESLYGSDPTNPRSIDASMTDGEAVAKGLAKPRFESEKRDVELPNVPGIDAGPNTVTDQFARKFFEDYFMTRGTFPLSTDELVAFVTSSVDGLVAENDVRARYKPSDLVVIQDSSKAALTLYAAQAKAAVTVPTETLPESELVYFYEYITQKDASLLENVRVLGKSYQETADALIKIPVPAAASAAHFKLANALYRTGEATEHMGAADTDPLRAMIGIGLYATASTELEATFMELAEAFRTSLSEPTP